MGSGNNSSKENNKENESTKPNPIIENIKSKYILSKIIDIMPKKKKLEIVEYNKKIQNRLNLDIKDYKEYSETFAPIEIEIIPIKEKYGKFINIERENEKYFHIYFNNKKEEIRDNYINFDEKIDNIKIRIDYQIKSFKKLFYKCEYIESINFKKFYRNNISDMSCMFSYCSSLKELNLSNFNTNNVTNMSCMLYFCSSLKELNLSNFNTNNVTDMRYMFDRCSDNLKRKIKSENKNIKDEAFW